VDNTEPLSELFIVADPILTASAFSALLSQRGLLEQLSLSSRRAESSLGTLLKLLKNSRELR
jgi:hypothetical protein